MTRKIPVLRYLLSLWVFIILFTGCSAESEEAATPVSFEDVTPLVSVTGKLVPAVWSTVGTQSGGMVTAVLVEEGDVIEAGDILVQFDAVDARLTVQQAEAALAAAKAQLAQIQAGPRAEEIAVAEAQIEASKALVSQAAAQRDELQAGANDAQIAAAKAQVAAAQAEQRVAEDQHNNTMECRTVTLPDGRTQKVCPALGTFEEQARYTLHAANEAVAAAQAQLSAALAGADDRTRAVESAVWAASAQRDVAQAQLELLKAGVRDVDVAVVASTVTQAQAALDAAQVVLERTQVRAPISGTVGMRHVRRGEFVAPGQPLVTLGNLGTLRVETTDLDEIDVAQVRIDQEVTVTFDALPDRTFTGRITRIAPMAESGGGGVNYTVVIELNELEPVLRWGMTAFVDIVVE